MTGELAIILRYSEIYLKKTNRGFFERLLMTNIEKSLKGIAHEVRMYSGRYLVENFAECDCDEIVSRLRKVFGIHSLSVATKVPTDMDRIVEAAIEICRDSGSFKVVTHRADKTFPLNSMQISEQVGGRILEAKPALKVDLHDPDFTVDIDVRESGHTLVYSEVIEGADGMPIGSSGKGLLLLSGGIDSPVAGQMIASRGMTLECIHFHSYPHTSPQARDKVVEIAKELKGYFGTVKIHFVNVCAIQEEIARSCDNDYNVTLLRRFMMRIAERVARSNKCECIVTGESLAQVASQTIEGMRSTESVLEDPMPVLRPLVGMNKEEIIERARKIGTYDISIEPFEDCCTVFLPRHPVIRPKLEDVLRQEEKLDVSELVSEAMKTIETVTI